MLLLGSDGLLTIIYVTTGIDRNGRCKVPNTACYNKIVQDREKYSPLIGLTCMRSLMWILRSLALISVYPDWMASSRTSWIKTYCSSTWTMIFLSRRNDITNPNTSTVFSAAIRCSMESTTMNVPVLPTPALQCTTWKNQRVKICYITIFLFFLFFYL